jgi:hypothetical protein
MADNELGKAEGTQKSTMYAVLVRFDSATATRLKKLRAKGLNLSAWLRGLAKERLDHIEKELGG